MDVRLKELRREFDALAKMLKGTFDVRQRDALTQQIRRVIQESLEIQQRLRQSSNPQSAEGSLPKSSRGNSRPSGPD